MRHYWWLEQMLCCPAELKWSLTRMLQTSTFSASLRDLEEDPLFGDEVPPDSRPPNSDWFSLSPPQSPDHPKNDGKTEVHKIVNRWANSLSYSRGCGGPQVADNVQLWPFVAASCVWCPMKRSRRIRLKAQAMTPTSEMHTDRYLLLLSSSKF